MRAVVQRVRSASVAVGGSEVARMGSGLLALVGVGLGDAEPQARELARRMLQLRIFPDHAGRMNRSLLEVGGTLGVVSQFTLFGDARGQRRPSFIDAAPPERARALYEDLVRELRAASVPVATGEFQAMMRVELVNDGPVTLLLDSKKLF